MFPPFDRMMTLLGGSVRLHCQFHSVAEVDRLVRRGVPSEAVDHLLGHLAMPRSRVLKALLLPPRTIGRYQQTHQALPVEASERIIRLARVTAYAEEIFADKDDALEWLNSPNPALGDEVPLDLLGTETGGQRVVDVLTRLAHGVYS